ncbi:BTB/POZ and TAZ domain-containing protein 3 [Apostasia shenzhenica]|uniref:BTB/POZ and TAZ domain-containing protein 3 n=1 Tax=Apostasia shenzhenica TaxID=1088818 RepID=A0A2I0AXE0_9ASPA|nr:BTB/POZ and TAZ domain-containing protein 3 [Apostasia shenzhenica]
MACFDHGSRALFHNTFSDLEIEDQLSDDVTTSSIDNDSISSRSQTKNVPEAPPLPIVSYRRINAKKICFNSAFVPYDICQSWNRLFDDGYGADLHILTDDKGLISAHSSVLGNISPNLRNLLDQTPLQGGIRRIKIHGVPLEAARAFVRFLYSFWSTLQLFRNLIIPL